MYDRPLARGFRERFIAAFVRVVVDWRLLLFELVLSFLVVPNWNTPHDGAMLGFALWMLIAVLGAAREAQKRQLTVPEAVTLLYAVAPAEVVVEIAPDTLANRHFLRQFRTLLETAGWKVEDGGAWLNDLPLEGININYSERSRNGEAYRVLAQVLNDMGYLVSVESENEWDEVDRAKVLIAEGCAR
ncbi:MAG: hypothetical protein WC273_09735 [Dehalococcoidia bacterium]